jgi:hypothetical protein
MIEVIDVNIDKFADKIKGLVLPEKFAKMDLKSEAHKMKDNNPKLSWNKPSTNFSGYQLSHGKVLDNASTSHLPLPPLPSTFNN